MNPNNEQSSQERSYTFTKDQHRYIDELTSVIHTKEMRNKVIDLLHKNESIIHAFSVKRNMIKKVLENTKHLE